MTPVHLGDVKNISILRRRTQAGKYGRHPLRRQSHPASGATSSKRLGPTRKREELGRGGRIFATALAAIWVAAGLTALAIGLWLRPAILPVLISPLALGYGWIWARVAVTGRRQEWPRWRRRQRRR